tara:strand:+ start:22544 stop:22837 length:294 start_codon:yes stop_codon:yes gene_type:complete
MSEGSLELEFVEELSDEMIGKCECGVEGCVSVMLRKKGAKVNYRIEYDPAGLHETNVVIRVEMAPMEYMQAGGIPIVFNGKCETNMDFAKALKMVIV